MMKSGFLGTMWRDLVADPEAICVLALSNLAALIGIVILQVWLCFGGR